jgi:hypothetical protein
MSFGYVRNKEGDGTFFFSLGPGLGLSSGVSGFASDVTSRNPDHHFDVSEYGGWGSAHNIGLLGSLSFGGNSRDTNDFSYGYSYTEDSGGFGIGGEIGYSWTEHIPGFLNDNLWERISSGKINY